MGGTLWNLCILVAMAPLGYALRGDIATSSVYK